MKKLITVKMNRVVENFIVAISKTASIADLHKIETDRELI